MSLLTALGGVLPAWGLDWPIKSTTPAHRVFAGYGHFAEDTSGAVTGFHFHEGVDIEAAAGTPVFAVQDGTVIEVISAGGSFGQLIGVSFGADTTRGIGYVHVQVANRPGATTPWACGDAVRKNDLLGTVASVTGVYQHVHFELTSNADGYNCTPGVTNSPALAGDPMEVLSPVADATKPTIEDVLFRDGDQEGAAAATYRTDVVAGRNVIFGNVDIIVKAIDRFGAFNSRLGLHKVGFELLGGPRVIPEQTLEHFTGTFISAPGSFGQFRNPDLAQVIYEFDNTAASNQDIAGGVLNDGFYIVTNKDRDDILQLADRDRYWNTDLRDGTGIQWNDQDAAGNRARFAGEAFFPDGDYTLRVFAEDEKGATNRTSLDKPITIDNFRPFLRKVEIKTLSGVLQLFEEWTFDGLNFIRSKTPKPFGPGRYSVALEFSEPVVAPAASVDGLGALPALESTDLPGQQKVFTTTLDLETPTTITDGDHTLSVTAKDPAGNDLLAYSPEDTSIDPATQLIRNVSGMQGVGGAALVSFAIPSPDFSTRTA